MSYDLNERLLSAVHSGDFGQALDCIIEGAQATYVSSTCGRTAVGTAALLGDAELLELLVQSCEEPQLNVFKHGECNDTHQFDHGQKGSGLRNALEQLLSLARENQLFRG